MHFIFEVKEAARPTVATANKNKDTQGDQQNNLTMTVDNLLFKTQNFMFHSLSSYCVFGDFGDFLQGGCYLKGCV